MNAELQNAKRNASGILELSVETAASLIGKVRMIDVREPAEYTGELGHIARTELVPLATLEHAAASWDRDQALIMVCRSGGRSGNGTQLLMGLGFTQVANMVGGMLAYNAAKLPVER